MAKTNNNQASIILKALSIQINLSGLSFCILNPNTNSIEHIEFIKFDAIKNINTVLDSVKHIFNVNTLLHQEFSTVTLIHQNIWQTLVPKALFNKDLLTDYLKYNTKILKTDFIAYDQLNTSEIVSVYIPYTNINNYIFDHFGSFTYKHQSTITIEFLDKIVKNNNDTNVFINFNTTTIDLIIFKSGKLELYNSFEVFTKEDMIYYILFTFEQLKLNPETVKVNLMGQIINEDENYKTIYKYIRFISIYTPEYNFNFNTKPLHLQHYFTILNSI